MSIFYHHKYLIISKYHGIVLVVKQKEYLEMEQLILTLGVTGVGVLTSFVFGVSCAAMRWCISCIYTRLGFEVALFSTFVGVVLCASIAAGFEIDTKNASINLSKRATPITSRENIEKTTSVGTCRYTHDTTLWIIDGVIVRKLVLDGTYTCIPDNKEI
jgi:hypothetical protein